MRIIASALRHGVDEATIIAIVERPLRSVVIVASRGDEALAMIGFDPASRLIEVIATLDDRGQPDRVIHADRARPRDLAKYSPPPL